MHTYDYYKDILRGMPKPLAFLDLDLLDHNIENILRRSNGKKIRLASKSLRSVGVMEYIFQWSNQFQGIMCFSAEEACYLAEEGFSDILIGYPIYDENVIKKVVNANKSGAGITLMVDCHEHIRQIEKIAKEEEGTIPLCVDIDMSSTFGNLHFGVQRSPIRTKEQALNVIERILSSPYVYLEGLMGYEAQIAGIGDNNPSQKAKSKVMRILKSRSLDELTKKRTEIIEEVQRRNISLRFINGGGTGSMASTTKEKGITEVTVGSGFYAPTLFDYYKDFKYKPALGFAIEIVRKPERDLYTCLGGGYIASGAVGEDKLPTPYLPVGASLLKNEGAGEVQTPILYKGKEKLHLGDPIFMRHSKAGEVCERFTHLICLSNGKIVDKMATYRGDGRCFL